VGREMRPRPAHNGDGGGGLYDLTKHRDSPHSSAPCPGAVGAGLLQQNVAKATAPPTSHAGRAAGGEMNFSLYGYMPYNPVYISHDKLNHALTSPAKDDVGSRPGRQVNMTI